MFGSNDSKGACMFTFIVLSFVESPMASFRRWTLIHFVVQSADSMAPCMHAPQYELNCCKCRQLLTSFVNGGNVVETILILPINKNLPIRLFPSHLRNSIQIKQKYS